jgi:hypothetical protein
LLAVNAINLIEFVIGDLWIVGKIVMKTVQEGFRCTEKVPDDVPGTMAIANKHPKKRHNGRYI